MRIKVQAPLGAVADHPEAALEALADIAKADGADRDEWLEKAIKAGGASHRHVHVSREPLHRVVKDAVGEAAHLHKRVMVSMHQAIIERLDRAAREADIERYLALHPEE